NSILARFDPGPCAPSHAMTNAPAESAAVGHCMVASPPTALASGTASMHSTLAARKDSRSATKNPQCPERTPRYLFPATAIGPAGRAVRCASCRHSWFQEGSEHPAAAPIVEADAPPPVPAPPPIERPIAEAVAAPAQDYDAFAHEPPFKPRRNPARRWTIAAA